MDKIKGDNLMALPGLMMEFLVFFLLEGSAFSLRSSRPLTLSVIVGGLCMLIYLGIFLVVIVAGLLMALSGEKAGYALMTIALLLLVAIITSTYLDIKRIRQSGTI